MVHTYGYFIDGRSYVKYFKLQKAFKLYLLYVFLWMHSFMDLLKVSSSPDKKEESTKEEEEEEGNSKAAGWNIHYASDKSEIQCQ